MSEWVSINFSAEIKKYGTFDLPNCDFEIFDHDPQFDIKF